MKDIDTKSLIIGALLTSTIFLGVAAVSSGTGKTIPDASTSIAGMARLSAEWDDRQEWSVKYNPAVQNRTGYQPFAYNPLDRPQDLMPAGTMWRKRIK